MKAAGLKSIRTSIQWSRLIDDLEKSTVNEKAVDFYNAVINEFIAQGIRPMINLNHFDLPVELLKTYGGWESRHVVDLYAGFAAKCFAEFSDRVSDWFTFNEPMVVVECAYLLGFHYPDIVDGKKLFKWLIICNSPHLLRLNNTEKSIKILKDELESF